MAGIHRPHVETVLVENSDDRLAAVEEAKRTGQPFQSVGSNGSVVVPHVVATHIFGEAEKLDTYVGPNGGTVAAHLEDYHTAIRNDPEYIPQTNEAKARAHDEYSANLVKKQQEENAKIAAMIKEGYEPHLAVQQANLERAREHELKSNEYAAVTEERNQNAKDVWTVVDESVKILKAEDLMGASVQSQASALQKVVEAPDVSEDAARSALITKDAIISGEEDFKDHAMDFESLQERDRPAVKILDAASSPQDLRDSTAVAQIYAGNNTEEAVEAKEKMSKKVAKLDGEKTANEPGKTLRKAEDSVNKVKPADEMKETPKE